MGEKIHKTRWARSWQLLREGLLYLSVHFYICLGHSIIKSLFFNILLWVHNSKYERGEDDPTHTQAHLHIFAKQEPCRDKPQVNRNGHLWGRREQSESNRDFQDFREDLIM